MTTQHNTTFLVDIIPRHPRYFRCQLPIESKPAYEAITAKGYRIGAEVLTIGMVSLSIFDPATGNDIDSSLAGSGPQVLQRIVEMLERTHKEPKP